MGEKDLETLLKNASPKLHKGDYVFVTIEDVSKIDRKDTILEFKEAEGATIIMTVEKARTYGLKYDGTYCWITLEVHSSLEAVGFTAAFATQLGKAGISCNVVAAFYHDHIFVNKKDELGAMEALKELFK